MIYEPIIMTIATVIIVVTLFIRKSKIDEIEKDIFRIITLVAALIIGILPLFTGNYFAFIMFSLGFCVAASTFLNS